MQYGVAYPDTLGRPVTRHGWLEPWSGPIYTECATGKTAWAERAHARNALRSMPKGHGMSAYRCQGCDLWHIGHLAPVVKRGMSER